MLSSVLAHSSHRCQNDKEEQFR